MSKTFCVTTWPWAYHIAARFCTARVTPSITTLPRRADPGDCHRFVVCRTVAVASPGYRLHFRILPQPRSCCVPSKSNDMKHVISSPASSRRTNIVLACGKTRPRFASAATHHQDANQSTSAGAKPNQNELNRSWSSQKRSEFNRVDAMQLSRRYVSSENVPLRLLVPQGAVALPECVHSVPDRCLSIHHGTSRFPPLRHQYAPTSASRNVPASLDFVS